MTYKVVVHRFSERGIGQLVRRTFSISFYFSHIFCTFATGHLRLKAHDGVRVTQIGIGRDKRVKSSLFGHAQKLTILERGPTKFVGRGNFVSGQGVVQGNGSSLIEQHAHLGGPEGRLGRVFQHVFRLGQRDSGKPLDELVEGSVFLKILEQRRDGHPRAAKNPSATHAIGVAFDIEAGGPVNHEQMVAL